MRVDNRNVQLYCIFTIKKRRKAKNNLDFAVK